MKKLALVGAAALGLAVPSVASAHNATVMCDTATGRYVVTADYQHLNPSYLFTDTTVTVTWSDGYKVVRQLPRPCVAPPPPVVPEPPGPTPTPVPPVVEVTPPPPVVPLTCAELLARYPKVGKARRAAWGCPAPPVHIVPHKTTKKRTDIVVRRVPCFATDVARSYTVHRVRTQTFVDGRLVGVKLSAPFRVYGTGCAVNG